MPNKFGLTPEAYAAVLRDFEKLSDNDNFDDYNGDFAAYQRDMQELADQGSNLLRRLESNPKLQ